MNTPKYLRQKDTGRIYPYTPAIAERADMEPCDAPEAVAVVMNSEASNTDAATRIAAMVAEAEEGRNTIDELRKANTALVAENDELKKHVEMLGSAGEDALQTIDELRKELAELKKTPAPAETGKPGK